MANLILTCLLITLLLVIAVATLAAAMTFDWILTGGFAGCLLATGITLHYCAEDL